MAYYRDCYSIQSEDSDDSKDSKSDNVDGELKLTNIEGIMTTLSVPISGDVVKYTQFLVPNTTTNTTDVKKDWFDDALVNYGYKDYFKLGPTTQEGHNEIPKFNNMMVFWKEKTDDPSFAMFSLCLKKYSLSVLIAEHGKCRLFISLREGMHHTAASTRALTGGVVKMKQPIVGVGDLT